MNQKSLVVILGVVVVILLGTTIYFATISNVNQPALEPVIKQSTQPVATQSASTTPTNPTALQTYTNSMYGFSFQYPNQFKIGENDLKKEPAPGGVVFTLDVSDNILVTIAKIEKGLASGFDPLAAPNGMDPISKKDTIVDGQKARIYNDGEVYVVAKNGNAYYLQIVDTEKPGKETLAKIVETFKFTK